MELTVPLRLQGVILLYRSYGWEVLPLKPNTKNEVLVKWAKLTDPVEVDRMFAERPDANVAVVLGERSRGLACQDFEIERDYLDYYGLGHAKLEQTTIVCTTPGGGIHVMAYSDNTFKKKVRLCEEHPLDVLGEGCMAVMPPSRIYGKAYTTIGSWKIDLEPDDNLLSSTVGRCSQLGWTITGSKARTPISSIIRGVPQGQRNNSAFKFSLHLLRTAKLDPSTALFELKRWNQLNRSPLPEMELVTVFKSAFTYSQSKKRRIKDGARWS